jgi:pyruvate dehydrogenase E2 component (dihydrolipoamide acetyltransferase)
MSTDVKLPDLGEGIDSAEVINVLVSEGDQISDDQDILEIETDKASVTVPSSAGGTVKTVHVSAGDTVEEGTTLLTLDSDESSDDKPEQPASEEQQQNEQQADEKPSRQDASDEQPESDDQDDQQEEPQQEPEPDEKEKQDKPADSRKLEKESEAEKPTPSVAEKTGALHGADIPAGPSVRRLARELGVDLSTVAGSGDGGRITPDDVKAAVRDHNLADQLTEAHQESETSGESETTGQDEDGWGPIHREKMTRVRATIAKKMIDSHSSVPHVTHFDDADVTDLEEFRQERKEDLAAEGVKLTLLPFVVKAVADTLHAHPRLNASLDLEGGQIVYHDYISIGLAVDTERGLVVPVLRDVYGKSIAQLAEQIQQIVEKVRGNDYGVEDLRGGTFTISNQGAVGGAYATPVINTPESAILLLGRTVRRPVVTDDGEIQPRLILPLSLSYDHRLVDGADAGRFTNALKDVLQYPGKLLLKL